MQHPIDKWIGRNILKAESQSEKKKKKLESKECPTFPGMGGGLCAIHFDSPRVPIFLKNEEPAHTKRILMPLKPHAGAAEN